MYTLQGCETSQSISIMLGVEMMLQLFRIPQAQRRLLGKATQELNPVPVAWTHADIAGPGMPGRRGL